MELRAAQSWSTQRSLLDRPLEWICSGIPTQQPIPHQHTTDLLRDHNLLLFPDEPVTPVTRSRQLIGYVTRDPEVMRLALALAHTRDGEHPLLIAARQRPYSAGAARARTMIDKRTRGTRARLNTIAHRADVARSDNRKAHAMGTGDKIRNRADILKGKAKETAGRAGDDPALEAEGRTDQAKGHVKQAGEKVKDAAKDVTGRK